MIRSQAEMSFAEAAAAAAAAVENATAAAAVRREEKKTGFFFGWASPSILDGGRPDGWPENTHTHVARVWRGSGGAGRSSGHLLATLCGGPLVSSRHNSLIHSPDTLHALLYSLCLSLSLSYRPSQPRLLLRVLGGSGRDHRRRAPSSKRACWDVQGLGHRKERGPYHHHS